MASSGLNTNLITDKSRSRREICLKLSIKTSKRNPNSKNIVVNKDMFIVYQKHLNKVLDMLQVVDKEAQSLLLALRQGILGLE